MNQQLKFISIFDLNSISTKSLEEDIMAKIILTKYGVKTYKQLESLIEIGKISDPYLIEALDDIKENFHITLNDILVDSLRVNKSADLLLTKYNITTFAELKTAILSDCPEISTNAYLNNALFIVTKTLNDNKKTRKKQKLY